MPGVAREFPSDDDDASSVVSAIAIPLAAARAPAELRRALWLLLVAVGMLHLLACANATSLLLAQAVACRRDAAIRGSLGGTQFGWRHFLAWLGLSVATVLLVAWPRQADSSVSLGRWLIPLRPRTDPFAPVHCPLLAVRCQQAPLPPRG